MRALVFLLAMALGSPLVHARERTLLHCFYFTPIEDASDADWDAFYGATDTLRKNVKGLKRVWVGKLTERAPVAQQVKLGRTYGACMEFRDEAALKSYATDPAHDEWVAAYEKVRKPGTTTFDILGQ